MADERIDPAFDVVDVDDSMISSLRNLLEAWCKHIAVLTVGMRELGRQNALVDAFLLEALEITSSGVVADAKTLTKKCTAADVVYQLASFLSAPAEGETPEDRKEAEDQFRAALDGVADPTEEMVQASAANGAELSDARFRQELGETAYGLHKTIFAGLQGVATVLRAEISLAADCRTKREFEAEGLRARINSLRKRVKKEKELREELLVQLEALDAEIASWRQKEREALDGVADVLAFLSTNSTDPNELVEALVKVGGLAVLAFDIYELSARYMFGEPVPASVRRTPLEGRCVLFVGDDYSKLRELLERASFNELNVWTYGEGISAHSLPEFSKYRRLVGHYGGSRCNQNKELGGFPGSIVVASGPFDEPTGDYADYVFAVEPTRWDGVAVIPRKEDGSLDLDAVVKGAVDSSGFFKSRGPVAKTPVGFGGEQLASLVEKLARAYRVGALKRVVAIGGDDTPSPEQDFYTKMHALLPKQTVTLTFGEVKFRINSELEPPTDYGAPRLIDLGRARDMNATLRFAAELNRELDKTPATSPVSFYASLWGEKSVACFLAMCASGYRDVAVGPYRPTVWNDEIVALLREKLGVRLVGDPSAEAYAEPAA